LPAIENKINIKDTNSNNGERVNLYIVGKIIGCSGVKGYVKVQPSTQTIGRLKQLHHIFIGASTSEVIPETIDDIIIDRKPVLMKFHSISDRTSAEKIIGKFIFIEEKELDRPSKGAHFIHDIIGCTVWLEEGSLFGTVEDVLKLPAQDVWVINKMGKSYLIPAVKEFIKEVDIKNRKIIIATIEGLIEE